MNDTTNDTEKDIDTPDSAQDSTNQDNLADDWAAALSEQKSAESADQAAGLHDFANQSSEEPTAEQPSNEEQSSDSADMDDWAAALAEQSAAESSSSPEDDWSAALAEQTAGEASQSTTAAEVKPAPDLFKPLNVVGSGGNSDIDMVMDIPVQLSVELGRTKLTIKNILQLGQGSVVELDGLAGEPMDIYVNGYLIAQGEVVVVDDKYGIRITDIITPSDRINRLNSRR